MAAGCPTACTPPKRARPPRAASAAVPRQSAANPDELGQLGGQPTAKFYGRAPVPAVFYGVALRCRNTRPPRGQTPVCCAGDQPRPNAKASEAGDLLRKPRAWPPRGLFRSTPQKLQAGPCVGASLGRVHHQGRWAQRQAPAGKAAPGRLLVWPPYLGCAAHQPTPGGAGFVGNGAAAQWAGCNWRCRAVCTTMGFLRGVTSARFVWIAAPQEAVREKMAFLPGPRGGAVSSIPAILPK